MTHIDIHVHEANASPEVERKLDRIIDKLEALMSLGQDILDAVTAENTIIDSFLTLVQGLVASNTIDQPTADKIKAAISAEQAKVSAAITANTPVGTASPTVLPAATLGQPYTDTLTTVARTGIAPFAWSVTTGALPDGLTLDATAGVISGTPLRQATFVFAIHVVDSQGTVVDTADAYSITVN